jgi:hypothetical protein
MTKQKTAHQNRASQKNKGLTINDYTQKETTTNPALVHDDEPTTVSLSTTKHATPSSWQPAKENPPQHSSTTQQHGKRLSGFSFRLSAIRAQKISTHRSASTTSTATSNQQPGCQRKHKRIR